MRYTFSMMQKIDTYTCASRSVGHDKATCKIINGIKFIHVVKYCMASVDMAVCKTCVCYTLKK